MKTLIFILLLFITIVFFMFEISLKSFSKISLTGFLEDLDNKKKRKIDLVRNYDTVINSLRTFTLTLQLFLFSYSLFLLKYISNENFIILFLLIFIFIIFFDLILYTISFFYKEKILKKLLPLQIFPWLFFYPANYIFSHIIKQKNSNMDSDPDELSEEKLKIFIEEGSKDGVIEKEDREMIESVLEFGDTLVKEIMTPRVKMQYIENDIKIDKLIETIKSNKKSRYPVISGRIDNIVGIILSKDIFNYWRRDDFKIKNIIREPFFIPETMRILELLKELQRSKRKFAIVVDEFGEVSGVVTMEDLIEEIVGDINDEYDEDVKQIVKEKDFFVVKGDTDVLELSEVLDIKIEEEEDYQTVSGLINFKLGKIPVRNEKILIKNYVFEVIEIENNRIKKVKIYSEKNN